jgi:hypothetical protein
MNLPTTGKAGEGIRPRNAERCVLCGGPRERVGKLILGMHGGVCHSCVDLCAEILRDERAGPPETESPPEPQREHP